jgi:hypothetical protein
LLARDIVTEFMRFNRMFQYTFMGREPLVREVAHDTTEWKRTPPWLFAKRARISNSFNHRDDRDVVLRLELHLIFRHSVPMGRLRFAVTSRESPRGM